MKTRKSSLLPLSVNNNKHHHHHVFLSKDGKYYDTYQLMVNANIRFNQERLKEKGLDQSSFTALKPSTAAAAAAKPPPPPRRRRTVTPVEEKEGEEAAAPVVRRSNRKRNAPPENNGLADDKDERGTINRTRSSKKARRRRRKTVANNVPALTKEQRSKLLLLLLQPNNNNNKTTTTTDDGGGDGCCCCWLPALETYLLQTEEISLANCRSVMRQVEKLVRGEGITYTHWKDNVVFHKGCKIQLSNDFGALFQQAVDFEDEHGRDLGNGWLLRHPIRKLENFQRYCHEKNNA